MMYLQKGDQSNLVKQWQQMLIQSGYGDKLGSADGIFGDKTATATSFFQGSNGLQIDGVVGLQTLVAMRNFINRTKISIPDPGPIPDSITNLLTGSLAGVATGTIRSSSITSAITTAENAGVSVAKSFPWKWVLVGGLGYLAYKKYRHEKVVILGKRIV